jgi:hypothetical protein
MKAKGDYDDVSDEWFDETLRQIVSEQSAGQILAIPGVYEVLAEYFNNEVLSRWEAQEQ